METQIEPDEFFFARDRADYYDETIDLAVPHYHLVFQTMVEVVREHFRKRFVSQYNDATGVVLDVGAGTGAEALALMQEFPDLRMLAVDLNHEMRDLFESNYQKLYGAASKTKVLYLVKDILNTDASDMSVQKFLHEVGASNCVAAVSAYCIHHFSLLEKRLVYQKMFDFLEPGGIVVNVDLFSYESSQISLQAHEFDIRFIETQFDSPGPQFDAAVAIPLSIRKELKNSWVHHMKHDNKLHSVDAQLSMLREIGFADAECIFRYWQQGIIRATKPL